MPMQQQTGQNRQRAEDLLTEALRILDDLGLSLEAIYVSHALELLRPEAPEVGAVVG
jgi:hypothetical protein